MAHFPRLCWTIAVADPQQALARARALKPASARFAELRLDYLADPDKGPEIVRSVRAAGVKVVATLRSVPAGGKYSGGIESQLRILEACGKAGAAIIDLEVEAAEQAGRAAVERLRRQPGARAPGRRQARLLVSFHNYRETPQNTAEALRRLKNFSADYYKVVALSSRHAENASLLALNPARGSRNVIAFALGDVGSPTRVLSVARGAPFTYAAISNDEAVAPGQLTGTELLELYRIEKISPRTALYGVIGNPIGHSLSPVIHNAAFASKKRDAVYLPFRVELLEDFLAAQRTYGLSGFSVTIPHKEAMAAAAGWVEEEAREAGAVNTIVVRGGKLRGYNTDLAGIIVPLEKRMKLRGARVLVAGAGGAARAAAFALARRKARVVVVGRRPEQAAALAEQVGGEAIERNSLSGEQFDAIVHTTPLGMHPDVESCFFSPGELNTPLLFETVYTPIETRLVRMARERKIKVIPGLEMFLEQAARQFELWTGEPGGLPAGSAGGKAPRAVMEKAAYQALGGKPRWL